MDQKRHLGGDLPKARMKSASIPPVPAYPLLSFSQPILRGAEKSTSALVSVEHAGKKKQLGMRRRQLRKDEANPGAVGGEFFPQGTQVIRLVPMQLLEIQNKTVPASCQGISDRSPQRSRIHRRNSC